MMAWPYAAAIAGLLALGLFGIATRREPLKLVLSLVVLAKGATLMLLFAGASLGQLPRAQAIAFVAMVIDASVAAVGIALVVRLHGGGGVPA